jgi:HD-GYP domain-containing protein (c-di-GMP phosphodiesterase class II)
MTANRRYQVAVEDLRLGMFVVELDRPWLDTPFLLQGFLVDSKVELDTLVKYCDYVYVDLEMSSPAVADLIRRVEIRPAALEPQTLPMTERTSVMSAKKSKLNGVPAPAASADKSKPRGDAPASSAAVGGVDEIVARAAAPTAASQRRFRPRADVKISQLTRQRFRNFVRQTADARKIDEPSFLERMFGPLFDLFGSERDIGSAGSAPAVSADLLPAGMVQTYHEQRRAMLEELPRARKAFSQGEETLAEVMVGIRSGKAPQLEAIAGAVDGMVESMLDNPDALMWIARLREEDINTYNHGVKVALYLVALGRHLGFPKQELAYLGQVGMLADIGKTKLPRAILEKPGMLSPAEFTLVKEHVDLAMEVLADGPKLPEAVTAGIAQHHERIDGSGYPKGLKGSEIGIYGKMAAIADSFAALITPRAYANASAPQDALMNLYEWSGTSFHEPMVEQFVQAIGVFPVGSMIELTTGEIGVVVAHNRIRRLEPKVLVLSNPDKSPLAQPLERDLYREGKAKGSKPLRITRGLPSGAYGFKLRDYYLDEIAKQNGIAA